MTGPGAKESEYMEPSNIIALMGVLSLMLMFSTTTLIDGSSTDPYVWYAFSLGLLGTIFYFIFYVLMRKLSQINGAVMLLIAVTQAVLWPANAIIWTFIAPFTQFGNGFIASWGLCLLAVYMIYTTISMLVVKFQSIEHKITRLSDNKKYIAICIVFSVMETIAASILCANGRCQILNGPNTGEMTAYAVALGPITIAFCIPLFIDRIDIRIRILINLIMALWVTCGTFAHSYFTNLFTIENANGYLGLYGMLVFAWFGMFPLFNGLGVTYYAEINTEPTMALSDIKNESSTSSVYMEWSERKNNVPQDEGVYENSSRVPPPRNSHANSPYATRNTSFTNTSGGTYDDYDEPPLGQAPALSTTGVIVDNDPNSKWSEYSTM